MPRKLIIDCDPGIDDAVALMLAFADPDLDVQLVTCVAGNVGLNLTSTNALRIAQFCKCHVPIVAGASHPYAGPAIIADQIHGMSGLGDFVFDEELDTTQFSPYDGNEFAAADAIANYLVHHPQEHIAIAAVGPLTNIAYLVLRHPNVLKQIDELAIMGGCIGAGNVGPKQEFNFAADSEAARIVIQSGLPIFIYPLETAQKAKLTPQMVNMLKEGNAQAQAICTLVGSYHDQDVDEFGWALYDPTTIAALSQQGAWKCESYFIDIKGLDSTEPGASYFYKVGDKRINLPIIRLNTEISDTWQSWFMQVVSRYSQLESK